MVPSFGPVRLTHSKGDHYDRSGTAIRYQRFARWLQEDYEEVDRMDRCALETNDDVLRAEAYHRRVVLDRRLTELSEAEG
jgi:hypothetical protein